MDMAIMRRYSERAEAARAELLKKPGMTPEIADRLRDAVNVYLDNIHTRVAEAMGFIGEEEESWDEVEMGDAIPAAEALAQELGITDEAILTAMRGYAAEHGAFKIQLSLESARDQRL